MAEAGVPAVVGPQAASPRRRGRAGPGSGSRAPLLARSVVGALGAIPSSGAPAVSPVNGDHATPCPKPAGAMEGTRWETQTAAGAAAPSKSKGANGNQKEEMASKGGRF